jgi:hypothetical protein
MMCIMAMLFGIVLMVLGIVGEYLGKIILILNKTPQYVVRETAGVESGLERAVRVYSGTGCRGAASGSAPADDHDADANQ